MQIVPAVDVQLEDFSKRIILQQKIKDFPFEHFCLKSPQTELEDYIS